MKNLRYWCLLIWSIRPSLFLSLFMVIYLLNAFKVSAVVTNDEMVNNLHEPQAEHADQFDLLSLGVNGQYDKA